MLNKELNDADKNVRSRLTCLFSNITLIFDLIKIFNFDVKDLKWPSYVEQYYFGTKKYLLNEDMSKLKEAREKLAK